MGDITLRAFVANLMEWAGKLRLNPRKDIKHTIIYGVDFKGDPTRLEAHRVGQADLSQKEVVAALSSIAHIVPAKKYWILRNAATANNNRASQCYVTTTDGAVATTIAKGAVASAAKVFSVTDLIGMKLPAGRTVTIVDVNFVAADQVTKDLNYEEYDVGEN